MKVNTKKIVALFFIMLLLLQMMMPCVMAVKVGESYYLQRGEKAFYSVQKKKDDRNMVLYYIRNSSLQR